MSEDINALEAEARELMTGCPADVPMKSYLQSVLMERVPMMTSSEAERIVNDIDSGIDEFNESYQANMLNENLLDVETLLQKMSVQEALDLLVSYRTCIRLHSESENPPTQERIDEVRETIANGYEPSEESIATLCDDLKKDLSQMQLDEKIFDGSHVGKLNMSEITPEAIDAFFKDQDMALCIAVLSYIHSVSDEESLLLDQRHLRMLGMVAATGVEQAKGKLMLMKGMIDEHRLEKIAKTAMLVLGIAIIASFFVQVLGGFMVLTPVVCTVLSDSLIAAEFICALVSSLVSLKALSTIDSSVSNYKTRLLSIQRFLLSLSDATTVERKEITQRSALLEQNELHEHEILEDEDVVDESESIV